MCRLRLASLRPGQAKPKIAGPAHFAETAFWPGLKLKLSFKISGTIQFEKKKSRGFFILCIKMPTAGNVCSLIASRSVVGKSSNTSLFNH